MSQIDILAYTQPRCVTLKGLCNKDSSPVTSRTISVVDAGCACICHLSFVGHGCVVCESTQGEVCCVVYPSGVSPACMYAEFTEDPAGVSAKVRFVKLHN